MGGTSGCCVDQYPNQESKFNQEAQTHGVLARKSVKYHAIGTMEDNHEQSHNTMDTDDDHQDKIITSPIQQNKKRGSIIRVYDETEDKNDEEPLCDTKDNEELQDVKLKCSRSRKSYENTSENIEHTEYKDNLSSLPSTKRHHKHHHKKHKKTKNKLVSALKECIKEFNKSIQSLSLLQLMSTKSIDTATSQFNQKELLEPDIICKYFKLKKYDIQWFLCTERNKFIKVMVNKWPNITILTAIKIHDMLKEKIHKETPAVSTSTLNLVSTTNKKNLGIRTPSKRKTQENILFTWTDNVNVIDDCDVNHFLYITSLVIKNLNQEKLRNNAHIKEREPLYHQMDILTYLLEIEMNGYLFRGISKNVFQLNIKTFIIDGDDEEITKYSMEYTAILHTKINQFDISKIYKQSMCTIEFTLSNSKRWQSVSSLIKGIKASDFDIDLNLDDDDDDDDEDEDESDSSSDNEQYHHDEDEKQREKISKKPDLLLKGSKNISDEMMELREKKDTLDTNEYIKRMEILQQKLAESLRDNT